MYLNSVHQVSEFKFNKISEFKFLSNFKIQISEFKFQNIPPHKLRFNKYIILLNLENVKL